MAALERAIFKSLQSAGRELLLQAFGMLEERVVTGAKQRRRRRYLITRFGEIRFHRWQTRSEAGYGHPLDEALELKPGDPCSAWVRQTSARLAQAHPFRQAAALLSVMIGQPVDHRRLWGWVQASGKQLRGRFEQMRASLFDEGEAPGSGGPSPKIVSTSADGTFIRTRDGPVEVKLGLWWTGAHLASPTAVHARYLLDGKGFYASTQGSDLFGQTFYALAASRAGIAKAKEVFFISDGAGWLADLPSDWIRPTAVQLDQFHGKLRISEVARDPERAARWWAWVTEHNLGFARAIHRFAHPPRCDRPRGRTGAPGLPRSGGRCLPHLRAPAGRGPLRPDGATGFRSDGARRRSRGGSALQTTRHALMVPTGGRQPAGASGPGDGSGRLAPVVG
jgi:hypothetical protein